MTQAQTALQETQQRLSVLLHYGQDAVTADLPGWFHTYNGRQTIEAGIKEGKQVFQMHDLKVRSAAALFLQEHLPLSQPTLSVGPHIGSPPTVHKNLRAGKKKRCSASRRKYG